MLSITGTSILPIHTNLKQHTIYESSQNFFILNEITLLLKGDEEII